MKKRKSFILLSLVCTLGSCKKETVPEPLASLNVVNATVGLSSASINYFGSSVVFSGYTATVAFGSNKVFTVNPGFPTVAVYSTVDTTKTLYSGNVTADAGGVYSLYLTGQSTAIDVVTVKENIPFHSLNDSVMGVRFINLSYNSTPVNITLSTTATVKEFSTVAYKSSTDFKDYAVLTATTPYTFQVRDANNVVLASFAFTATTMPRFLNCTLAFIGQVGGTGANAPKLIRINNY